MDALKAAKRARDLISAGEQLVAELSCARNRIAGIRLAAWTEAFETLVNDESLQVSNDPKAIRGVPKALSLRLWELDRELSRFPGELRCETKTA